ncbi:hypothetical protein LPC08_15170 [Roseomonas sp. OT10]|uniref:hypothetical protein n=1 Tax=Roseomonas cutis TaxID=2897332 RepID=UPI001E305E5C|nr:hypothetical protein [Roseomonas sp. OT10]UFN47359.1 hypothetical protein LPC08_15170 [Roseomonas sp. OT10]
MSVAFKPIHQSLRVLLRDVLKRFGLRPGLTRYRPERAYMRGGRPGPVPARHDPSAPQRRG